MRSDWFSIRFLAWCLATSAVCASSMETEESSTHNPIEETTTEDTTTTEDKTADDKTTGIYTSTLSQTSIEILLQATTTVAPHSTTQEESDGEPRKASGILNPFDFPLTSGCGTNVSCIRYSPFHVSSCSKENCVYLASYLPLTNEDPDIVFHLSASVAGFVAIGFTDNIGKSKTDIIACIRDGDKVVARAYYWPDASSTRADKLTVSDYVLELIDGNGMGKGLWCSVKRLVQSRDRRLKNLREYYRQVYLWGPNNADGTPAFVDETTAVKSWEISKDSMSLSDLHNSTSIVHSPILPTNLNCKLDQLSCVRYETTSMSHGDCNYKTCSYQLAFTRGVQQSQNWPLFLSANNAEYVGLGRTQDKSQWANTDVIGCKKTSNNEVVPFHYWINNPKQNYERQIVPNGLKMIDGGVTDSGLWCSLSTLIRSADVSYSNLSNPAYMLYMWGKVDEDGEPKHWAEGFIKASDLPVNLTAIEPIRSYNVLSSGSAQQLAGCVVWVVLLTSYLTSCCC